MKNTKLKSLDKQSLKEKRLIFAETPQQLVNKELVGEAHKDTLKKSTPSWEKAKAESTSFIGNAQSWIKDTAGEHSAKFKADVKQALKDLKTKYDAISWAAPDAIKLKAFKATMKAKIASLKGRVALSKSKRKLNNLKKSPKYAKQQAEFKEANVKKFKKDLVDGIKAKWDKVKPASLQAKIKKLAIDGLKDVEKGAVKGLKDVAGMFKSAESITDATKIDAKIAEIKDRLKGIPASLNELFTRKIKAVAAKEKVIKFVYSAVALAGGLDLIVCKGALCKAAKKSQKSKIDGLIAKMASGKAKPADIIAAERKIELNIMVGYLQDALPAQKEALKIILTTYDTGVGSKLTPAQRAKIKSLVKALNAKPELKELIDIRLDAGADAETYKTSGRYEKYKKMSAVAERMLTKIPNSPYVIANKALLNKMIIAADSKETWDAFVAKNKKALEAPAGPLNTILAYQRLEDKGGDGSKSDDLINTLSKSLYLETTGIHADHRYSLVVSAKVLHRPAPSAGGSTGAARRAPGTTPGIAPALTRTPEQVAVASMNAEKAKIDPAVAAAKTQTDRLTAAQKTPKIKGLEADIKDLVAKVKAFKSLDATRPPLKGKITEINKKTLAIRGALAKLNAKVQELKTEKDKIERVPAATGLTTSSELDIPKNLVKGKEFKFGAHTFVYDGANEFRIAGGKHQFGRKEVYFLGGKSSPDKPYMESKIGSISYFKATLKPADYKYDYATDTVTGRIKSPTADADNYVDVSYNMKTGKRTISTKSGHDFDIKPFLPADKQTDLATLNKALVDGFRIKGVDGLVKAADREKDLKNAIISGEYDKAITLITDKAGAVSPRDVNLLTRCVEGITLASLGSVCNAKLKGLLPQIITGYNKTITAAAYKKLKTINGTGTEADLKDAKQLLALRNNKKVHVDVYKEIVDTIEDLTGKAKEHAAVAYLEKAYDKTKNDNINIAAIKAYPAAKVASLGEKEDIIIFVSDNFDKFDADKAKNLIKAYLKEKKSPNNDVFKNAFQALYPGTLGNNTGITPATGADVYAKYVKAYRETDLLNTGIHKILRVGSDEVTFLDACLDDSGITALGAMTSAGAKEAAKKMLKILNRSGHPKAKVYAQEIVDTLSLTESPDKKKERVTVLYTTALDANAAPARRKAAFKELLTGKFKNENSTKFNSLNDFHSELEKHYSLFLYAQKTFGSIKGKTLDALKPKQAKKFVEIYNRGSVTDDDLKYLLTKVNKKAIGAEALYDLADLSSTSNAQSVRIWKSIGMIELAKDTINNVTDGAEKALLGALLVSNKPYKVLAAEAARGNAASAEKLAKIDKLLSTAYSKVTAATKDTLQLDVVEQLFTLSQASGKIRQAEILTWLKMPSVTVLPGTSAHTYNVVEEWAGEDMKKPTTANPTLSDADKKFNALVSRAEAIAAKRELAIQKLGKTEPSVLTRLASNNEKTITAVTLYIQGRAVIDKDYKLSKNPADEAMVKQLYAQTGEPNTITDDDARKDYSVLLVKLCKKSKDKKYIQKIKPDDLAGNDKADYHVLMAKFNPADAFDHFYKASAATASYEDGLKYAKKALKKAGTDKSKKNEVADLLESYKDRPSEKFALKIYTDTKEWVKIHKLLTKASDKTELNDADKIAGLKVLKNSPRPDLAISVALVNDWHKRALAVLKAKKTNMPLSGLKAGLAANAYTVVEFTDVIVLGDRKVDPGSAADKKTQYDTMYGSSPKLNLDVDYGPAKKAIIRKAFGLST